MPTIFFRRIALAASITAITGCASAQLQKAGDEAFARGDYAQALADYKAHETGNREDEEELTRKRTEAGQRLAAAEVPKARASLDAGDMEAAIRAARPLYEIASPEVRREITGILSKAGMTLWAPVEKDLRDPKKRPGAIKRSLELAFYAPEIRQRLAAFKAELAQSHVAKAAATTSPVTKYAHQQLAHHLDPSIEEPANIFVSESVRFNIATSGDPCDGFRDGLKSIVSSPASARHVVSATINLSRCEVNASSSTTSSEEEYFEQETRMVDKVRQVCDTSDKVEQTCTKDVAGNPTGNCTTRIVKVNDCKNVTYQAEESVPVKRTRTVTKTKREVELAIAGSISFDHGGKTESASFSKSSGARTPTSQGGISYSDRVDLQHQIEASVKSSIAITKSRVEASVRKTIREEADEAERRGDAERALFLRVAAARLARPVEEPLVTWYSREISPDETLLECALGTLCPPQPYVSENKYDLVLPEPDAAAGKNDVAINQIRARRDHGGESSMELGLTYLNVPSFGQTSPVPVPSKVPSLGLLGGLRGEVHFFGGRETPVIGIPLDLRVGFDIKGNFALDSSVSGLFGFRALNGDLMLAALAGTGVDMIAGFSDEIYCVPIGLFAQLGGVINVRFPGLWELNLRGSYVLRTGDRVDTEKRAEVRLLRFIASGDASLTLAVRFTRYEGDILPRDGLRALGGVRF